MEDLKKSHSSTLIEEHCEVHTAIAGFWSRDAIQEYFDSVNETAIPLMKARKPIYTVVDFTGFVPQDRETSEAIRDHLVTCVKFGLQRIAIIGASPLTMMQYKRLSQGIEVNFVDSKAEAINWLRERRDAA
jgi:hypothetical protein